MKFFPRTLIVLALLSLLLAQPCSTGFGCEETDTEEQVEEETTAEEEEGDGESGEEEEEDGADDQPTDPEFPFEEGEYAINPPPQPFQTYTMHVSYDGDYMYLTYTGQRNECFQESLLDETWWTVKKDDTTLEQCFQWENGGLKFRHQYQADTTHVMHVKPGFWMTQSEHNVESYRDDLGNIWSLNVLEIADLEQTESGEYDEQRTYDSVEKTTQPSGQTTQTVENAEMTHDLYQNEDGTWDYYYYMEWTIDGNVIDWDNEFDTNLGEDEVPDFGFTTGIGPFSIEGEIPSEFDCADQ